jgi:hypothetical protein
MFIVTVVISALLAAVLVASAHGKLTKNATQMTTLGKVGVPENKVWLLAMAELAGAVGLVVGLFWSPLGILAAAGVIAYFVGAVGAHLRKGDRQIAPPAVLMLVAVAALIFRAVSA